MRKLLVLKYILNLLFYPILVIGGTFMIMLGTFIIFFQWVADSEDLEYSKKSVKDYLQFSFLFPITRYKEIFKSEQLETKERNENRIKSENKDNKNLKEK